MPADRGLLAEGPAFLIEAYDAVLDRHGCRPSRKVASRPVEDQRVTIAHFGESFVIARGIDVRQLSAA